MEPHRTGELAASERWGASNTGEHALRAAIEDFFFGFRAFTALPDELLAARGLSRTHHRVLYFVRRSPGLSMGDLLDILGITKQAAHRPLADLQRTGLLAQSPDPDDRRVRRLHVTEAGRVLEAELSGVQMRLLAESFAAAGPEAEAGWRAVMGALRTRLGITGGASAADDPPIPAVACPRSAPGLVADAGAEVGTTDRAAAHPEQPIDSE